MKDENAVADISGQLSAVSFFYLPRACAHQNRALPSKVFFAVGLKADN